MIAHPNVPNNKGRGSLLYIRNDIKYKQLNFSEGNDIFDESIYIEIKLNGQDKLLCSCMYRRGESSEQNNENLLNNLNHISKLKYSHLLIMGDFNLTEIDWQNCSSINKNPDNINYQFAECIKDCYLYQHINEPTRQRGSDTPSTLDLIFTNEEDMISNIKIDAPLGKSDHSVIHFDYNCTTEKPPPQIKTIYQKGDYNKMKSLLSHYDWEDLKQHSNDINKQWNMFKTRFLEAENDCVPKKMTYINGKLSKKLSTPLGQTTLHKIKQKKGIWGRIRKELADEEEKLQYNRLRNQVRRLTRKSKKLIEKDIAKNSKSNPKAFWKYSQSKIKTRTGIPDLVAEDNDDDSIYTKNNQEKTDVFLRNFSSVFTIEPDGELPPFEKRIFQEELNNINITEDMVNKKLKKLKINKSPGPDKLHPRALREMSDAITKPITIIFRTSLELRELPAEWKHANVSAIYKKGNKTHPLNYRPVSLTSVICKTLESIIREHVINHMRVNKLFSNKQFGFIGGRSTTLQLIHVLDMWTEILDQGGTLDTIYCDFMKAFDKVPHRRLIHKIKNYGITGNILDWIESFLSNRTQCVVLDNEKSNIAPVTSGIPQGSVLGPILFVLYINDMPEVVDEKSEIFLLADDTKIFRKIESEADTIQLQKDIENLVKWSEIWPLRFHPDKCVSMTVSNKRSNPPVNRYYMGSTCLQISDCEKDIGVYIDNKISFDTHINNMIFKANRVSAVVRNTFDHMNEDVFQLIFKGLIRPLLEYAAPIWSPHTVYQKELIENVQRRATKLIPGFYNLSYPERLRKLNMPTLSYRRARGDMIQVFKLLVDEGGYDKSLPNILTPGTNEDHDLRGHNKKLFMKGSTKDVRKYVFSHRVIKTWNSLPKDVINSKDVINFEKSLDSFWKTQTLLYDDYNAEITTSTNNKA